ncbi:CMD domain-containing protein [Pseudocitrobacter cyperus]|uniref:CMD domain-containing protein n=1 Tax=Pseudocitrobacter cyperus TaxID=3112843 RepID=A0ABV0HED6_9ENTR
MEQRRAYGKSHWYHETQSRSQHSDVLPLVPEAAHVEDRFLLGLQLPESLQHACKSWLSAGRDLAQELFPEEVAVSRLRTFSAYDRLSSALTVAQVCGVQRLCNHYAARLAPLPGPDSSRESNHRLAQITQYARQLASSPSVITPLARQQLDDVGLTSYDIILITQIVGFVGFQARVVANFQAQLGQPVRWIPGMPTQEDASADIFSAKSSTWQSDLPAVDERYASKTQAMALRRWQSQPVLSQLVPFLVHEERILEGLGLLINALPAASPLHALAALVPARINGSVCCFNHYSSQWQGASGLPDAIRNGDRAIQAWCHQYPREQAVTQAIGLLTRAPDRFSPAQFAALTEQGVREKESTEILTWSALFGWLNRLRIALRSESLPEQRMKERLPQQ